jgi:steroid 5-alpha reductase family enzyme
MNEVLIVLSSCYILLFIFSIKIKDNSIVDIFWWLWFLILAIVLLYNNWFNHLSQIVTLILIVLWSLRISINIFTKKLKHKWEDKRYSKWREKWKYFYIRSFFQIYVLQMVLLIIIAWPIFIIFEWNGNNNLLNILWSIIWLLWLIYETIADLQIQKFINTKEKKINTICTHWLWKYSRHPNYLWEMIFWLWITIISIQYSFYWVMWFVTISFLLLFVSGVPLKENYYKNKNNYEEYIKDTPLFIPKYKKF